MLIIFCHFSSALRILINFIILIIMFTIFLDVIGIFVIYHDLSKLLHHFYSFPIIFQKKSCFPSCLSFLIMFISFSALITSHCQIKAAEESICSNRRPGFATGARGGVGWGGGLLLCLENKFMQAKVIIFPHRHDVSSISLFIDHVYCFFFTFSPCSSISTFFNILHVHESS